MDDSLGRVAWPVTTERLTLRRAVPADLEPTWRFRRLPEVTRWLTAAPSTVEDYESTFTDPGRLGSTLVVEQGGTVIGDLTVRVEDAWSQREVKERARNAQAELGWCFDPAYAGRGLATEAVRALLDVCLGQLGLHRVYAACFTANEPSWRLMERVGMRREMHGVKDSLHRSEGWMDGYTYALLADEWSG